MNLYFILWFRTELSFNNLCSWKSKIFFLSFGSYSMNFWNLEKKLFNLVYRLFASTQNACKSWNFTTANRIEGKKISTDARLLSGKNSEICRPDTCWADNLIGVMNKWIIMFHSTLNIPFLISKINPVWGDQIVIAFAMLHLMRRQGSLELIGLLSIIVCWRRIGSRMFPWRGENSNRTQLKEKN